MNKIKVKNITDLTVALDTLTGCIVTTAAVEKGELSVSSVFVPGEHYDEESGSFVRIKDEKQNS